MGNYETSLLEQFFLNPMTEFGVRKLGRMTNMDTKTVMKYLKEFSKRGVVVKKEEKGKHNYYEADRLSRIYRHEKSELLIKRILESGLLEFLEQELKPKAIVLFGSVQKGTYHTESDIDLFIQADYKKLDLKVCNKKLGHEIKLFFEKDLGKLSKGLLENIYNGLVLSGNLEAIT